MSNYIVPEYLEEEEIQLIIDLLSHPAGFDMSVAQCITIRPIDENCPPKRFEVMWFIDKPKYQEFDSLKEAAKFFVKKRYELRNGLDFETNFYKSKNL